MKQLAGLVGIFVVAFVTGCHTSTTPATGAGGGNTSTGARLVLQPAAATVNAGGSVTLTIRNVGNAAVRYRHPGGSNGCTAFHWNTAVTTANSVTYTQHAPGPRRQICTAVMVPPRDIVIAPGAVGGKLTISTAGRWWANAKDNGPVPHQPGTPLDAGVYTIHVSGVPAMPMTARISVTK